MFTFLSLLGGSLVLLVPGLAAVWWDARTQRESLAATFAGALVARRAALLYSGMGVSCLALWLTVASLGLSTGTVALAIALAAIALVLGVLLDRALVDRSSPARAPRIDVPGTASDRGDLRALLAVSLASVVLVALPFVTHGWERGDGVHRMAMADWEHHIVIATAVSASPEFPPPHPYIHADPEPSYYFGYHLLAAAMVRFGGASGDVLAALLLLTLATAAATPFVVYTFCQDLCSRRQAVFAAASSTLLVGFDGVVVVLETVKDTILAWPLPPGMEGLRAMIASTHIDFWVHNLERSFSAPIISTMWSPHNRGATLLALLVLYLLAPSEEDPGRARSSWLLPAMLIAALPALSAYIAIALGIGLAAALLVEVVSERRLPWHTSVLRRWLLPGTVAVALALPILPVLARGSSSGLIVHVSAAGTWSNGAVFSWLFGPQQWTNLLDTPALYLTEFGVIGLLGTLQLLYLRRQRRFTVVQREAAALVVAVMIVVTFIRPPLGVGNNLFARAPLLVWFVLAAFAAMAASRIRLTRWLGAAVLACAFGTFYAEIGYLLEGSLFWATPSNSVEAIRWVNDNAEPGAVVAIRPAEYETNYGYWLRRPVVLAGRRLALLFGADASHFDSTAAALEAAYVETDPAAASARFDELEADVILVRSTGPEPAWAVPPCFRVPHRNDAWIVVLPDPAACGSR